MSDNDDKGTEGLPIFSEQLPAAERENEESVKLMKEIRDVPNLWGEYKKLKAEGLVKIPGKDAPAEEMHSFFTRLGKPDKAEEYDIKKVDFGEDENAPMETSDEFIQAFKAKVHQLNLSKGQAEGLYNWFTAGVKDQHQRQLQSDKDSREQTNKKLRDLWGQDYDKRMGLATKAAMKYGDDDIKKMIEKDGMKNHPGLAVMLSRIGQDLGEDFLIKGSVPGTGPQTEEEKRQARLKEKYPSMYE